MNLDYPSTFIAYTHTHADRRKHTHTHTHTVYLWQRAFAVQQFIDDGEGNAKHRGESQSPAYGLPPPRVHIHPVIHQALVVHHVEQEDPLSERNTHFILMILKRVKDGGHESLTQTTMIIASFTYKLCSSTLQCT